MKLIIQSKVADYDAWQPVFAAHDITKTQWSALVALHFDRASTCAEIARDLGHDKGATTRLVDTLEERGWVTRARGEEDRRMVRLTLTPSGDAIAATVRDAVIAVWNDWLHDWKTEDVIDLIRLLGQLRDTLQQTPDESAPA